MRGMGAVSIAALSSQAFADNPHEHYKHWRDAGGIHQVRGSAAWLVLDYENVSAIARQSSLFSSKPNAEFSAALHGADAPEHVDMRKVLQPLFAPELQLERRHVVQCLVKQHVDRVRKIPRFDAVSDLAVPLSRSLACDWLGLRPDVAELIGSRAPREVEWADVEPGIETEGLLGRLSAVERVPKRAVAELAAFLLVAGAETVRDAMLFGLLTLSRLPSQTTNEIDPVSLPVLADELLRLEPPVHTLQRRVVTDREIAGRVIPAGSIVWASIASANRDPLQFKGSDSIRLDRDGPKHISFGAGPHFCLGSHLGKLEFEVILGEMIEDLPEIAEKSGKPQIAFSGPGGAPSLRRINKWTMSLTPRA